MRPRRTYGFSIDRFRILPLMDKNLIRLDARLGALELLIRNLYAQRYAGQSDPLASAEQAAREIERLSRRIKVKGLDPAVNDLLASEA